MKDAIATAAMRRRDAIRACKVLAYGAESVAAVSAPPDEGGELGTSRIAGENISSGPPYLIFKRLKSGEVSLKTILFDSMGRLRNGWWIVTFVAFVAVTRFLYRPAKAGLRSLGAPESWLEPVAFLLALLATWACLRLRKETLASVGFALGRRWFRLMATGMLVGGASMCAVVGMMAGAGGVRSRRRRRLREEGATGDRCT